MHRRILHYSLLMTALLLAPMSLHAQNLVFSFINPSFGGNSYNGSLLLSEAQAQNGFKESSASGYSSSYYNDPLSDFKQSLNRQILSQLTQQFVRKMYGEDGLKDGHYELGDYVIDITQGPDGVNIDITDNRNGGVTNIVIPYF